jgi:MFS family permease
MTPGLHRNPFAIRALAFFQVFMVIVPVAVPLFGDRGLDLAGILELQALFGITVVLAEVPSGYVADLFGRRPALILGGLFLGIGHTLLLFADDFLTLALFEIALGLGVSLISGADVAVLYDTSFALGEDRGARSRALGGLFFIRSVSEAAAGLAASAVLLVATLDDLVVVQFLTGWAPLAFALLVVEPPLERMAAGSHLHNLGGVLRALFTSGAVVRGTFLMLAVWSLTTFYAVWLLQQHWVDSGVALSAFGLMWALLAVAAGLAGRHAAWLEAHLGFSRLLLGVALLPAFGYFALAGVEMLLPVTGSAAWGAGLALAIAPVFFVARGAGFVVLQEALNSRLAGHHRATANSLVGFVFRGLYAATVPVTGTLLGVWTLAEVMLVLGGVTLAVCVGVVVPLLQAIRRTPVAPPGSDGGQVALQPAGPAPGVEDEGSTG